MLRALLILAAAPGLPATGQFTRPGVSVILGDRAEASSVPELEDASGPVVLLSLYPNMDVQRIGADLGLNASEAAGFYLRPHDRERADDFELIEALRGAAAIGLWGGELESWYAALWPHNYASGVVEALVDAHRNGALVVARGEAAMLLTVAAAWDGEWTPAEPHRRPASPPHDREAGVGPLMTWNLALQPWAAFDSEARSSGSAWDLIDLLVDDRLRLGVYLEDEAALVFDPAVPEYRVRGDGAVWVFDLRNARRGKSSLQGARFSLLHPGDGWSRRRREVRSSGEPIAPVGEAPRLEGGDLLARIPWEDREAMGAHRLGTREQYERGHGPRELLESLLSKHPVLDLRDGSRGGRPARFTFRHDADSRGWRRGERATLSNLRLDLEWER